jgi:hypothetical protein
VRVLGDGAGADLVVEGEGALVAVGWATVDLERTASEVPDVRFGDPGQETALGARALRTTVGSIELLLLEPATEGRLAGWLARNGEGVAVLYVEPAQATEPPGQPTALGRLGRLERHGGRIGPFWIVLEPD